MNVILILLIVVAIYNMIYKTYICITYHWKDIPRGELHQSLEAKKPENKVKNRYTTIYPCMYFSHSDSYIHLHFSKDAYNVTPKTICFIHRWSFKSYFEDNFIDWRRLYQCKLHRSKYLTSKDYRESLGFYLFFVS